MKARAINYIVGAACAMACAFGALSAFCASPAATQSWVRDRFQQRDGGAYTVTNGVVQITTTNGTDRLDVRGEISTRLALVASNATDYARVAFGVTNGYLWAWNGTGAFRHGDALPILLTSTNMTYNGVSCHTNAAGSAEFMDWFSVNKTKVTETKRTQLLGGAL